ncbi:DEAD/DEAH box helicase [Lactococcus petauri]|uniref:DEAD/DEAH box helicase n=1 Tax=Lactococcus petauri TaxID=1940789 RepID=UPI003853B165
MTQNEKLLGESIYNDISTNEYLQELYLKILQNYTYELFSFRIEPPTFNATDALRFADILSKSTHPHQSDTHKLWAQEMVALLHSLYPNDKQISYCLSSILSNNGNYRGLSLVNSNYNGDSILDKIYTGYKKELFKVPGQDNMHFFESQKMAFDKLNDPYFSYSGPTSMGKSFIMRMFIKQQIEAGLSANFAIIVPTKALINEVTSKIINDLKENLALKDYRLVNSVGALALKQKHNFIFVLTPERLLYLLMTYPKLNIDYLFIDEAHKISSKDKRSSFYYKVTDMISRQEKQPHIIFASPNIPNPEVYLKLIPNAESEGFHQLATSYSPVSQLKYFIDLVDFELSIYNKMSNSLNRISQIDKRFNLTKMVKHIGNDSQNIVYSNAKEKAVDYAIQYAKGLPSLDDKELEALAKEIKTDVHNDYYLAELIEKGVAYHVGYLPANIRLQIEELYKKEKIRTVFCTSTLVEGVNLPADNLFITSYKNGRPAMNEVEFKNLIGRVGRIEYNLYGNVYLVRLNENDKKEKFEELLENDVPTQKLSIVSELNNNQKKKIVDTLLTGSVEFKKHPKKQTADEYDLMRKFALILLKDITEGKTSLVKDEFSKQLTSEIEIKIKSAFEDRKSILDNDINISIDQTGNLQAAIANGLKYPKIVQNKIDYDEVLLFLEKLCKIFKWEIYERSTLGHVSKKSQYRHALLRWYAVILNQWIQGNGLSFIVSEAITFKEEHPKSGVKIGQDIVPYDFSKKHKNIVIGETLSVIDTVILFSISNYFLRFSTEYKKFHKVEEFDNDWYEYVEYGTTNKLTILLQKNGFSRESSTFIKKHQDEYVIKQDGKIWLSLSLLDCPNSGVRHEVADIQYNVPELFKN